MTDQGGFRGRWSSTQQDQHVDEDARRQHPLHTHPKMTRLWNKLGLDVPTLILMLKGSIPPIIGIAMFQSPAIFAEYQTLTLLIPITSVIALCILPRAKFLQILFLNVISACIAGATNLLALYCGIQARLHSTAPRASLDGYNSSQSTVLALCLTAQIFVVQTLRVKVPQLYFPSILYSIFTIVCLTVGTQFTNVPDILDFIATLLKAFMTGFALSFGVSLLVIPMSCRASHFKQLAGYMTLLTSLLRAYQDWLESLSTPPAGEADLTFHLGQDIGVETGTSLRQIRNQLLQLHLKIEGDLPFTRHEVAIGKLSPADIDECWTRVRSITLPLVGLTTLGDRTCAEQREPSASSRDVHAPFDITAVEWTPHDAAAMADMVLPFVTLIGLGLQHAATVLQIAPSTDNFLDEESHGAQMRPGSTSFTDGYQQKLDELTQTSSPSAEKLTGPEHPTDDLSDTAMLEYTRFLLGRSASTVLDLLLFAERTRQNGSLSKIRLIVPTFGSVLRWRWPWQFHRGVRDSKNDPHDRPYSKPSARIVDMVHSTADLLRSDACAFAFRVCWATMTAAICCYLEASQTWFLRNRILWGVAFVPVSMSSTAGHALFSFLVRVAGTAIATVGSYLIWYVADGRTAGVIVLLWFWIFVAFYFVIKFPKLAIAGVLSLVTAILVIGYELEVRALGIERAEASGQMAYPTYILAPIRLATVSGGLLVAFIWTIFPYPVKESVRLRVAAGEALSILAEFSLVVHESIRLRLLHHDDSPGMEQKALANVEKDGKDVFTRLKRRIVDVQTLLASSQVQARFSRMEFVGCHERIIASIRQVAADLAVEVDMAPALVRLIQYEQPMKSEVLPKISSTFRQHSQLLSLLGSSLSCDRRLPPGLETSRLAVSSMEISSTQQAASCDHKWSQSALATLIMSDRFVTEHMGQVLQSVQVLNGQMDYQSCSVTA